MQNAQSKTDSKAFRFAHRIETSCETKQTSIFLFFAISFLFFEVFSSSKKSRVVSTAESLFFLVLFKFAFSFSSEGAEELELSLAFPVSCFFFLFSFPFCVSSNAENIKQKNKLKRE